MLRALATDWSTNPTWQVTVCWDPRIGEWDIPAIEVHEVGDRVPFLDAWQSISREADYVLVIAPEIDNQIVEIVRTLREQGACLLNADERFLVTASDKWLTAQAFQQSEIAHPTTLRLNDVLEKGIQCNEWHHLQLGWAIKPRDGAGCLDIRHVRSLKSFLLESQPEIDPSRYIVQPWIDGIAGSVAVLCGASERVVLPAMYQNIPLDHSLASEGVQYLGGRGPWNEILQTTLEAFANRVISALPGLPRGWIGIDFIQTEAEESNQSLIAIEVNPRLTTSYIGLRKIIAENLADLLFQTAVDQKIGYSLSGNSVRFDSFGKLVDQ